MSQPIGDGLTYFWDLIRSRRQAWVVSSLLSFFFSHAPGGHRTAVPRGERVLDFVISETQETSILPSQVLALVVLCSFEVCWAILIDPVEEHLANMGNYCHKRWIEMGN